MIENYEYNVIVLIQVQKTGLGTVIRESNSRILATVTRSTQLRGEFNIAEVEVVEWGLALAKSADCKV